MWVHLHPQPVTLTEIVPLNLSDSANARVTRLVMLLLFCRCGGLLIQSSQGGSQADAELATAVMKYLAEHPKAMDTLEGIAEWWVMRQQARVDLDSLSRVLRLLAAQGLVDVDGEGDQARYRLK